jgi:DNA repair exonuclease SbcCD ATPase subunit
MDIGREEKLVVKLSKEIETLANHECHTCGQAFHDAKHQQVLDSKQAELATAQQNRQEFSGLLSELQAAHESLGTLGRPPAMFYDRESDAIQHQATVASLEQQITAKQNETDPYAEQIEEMQQQALKEITYDALNELTRLQEHQDFLLKLLTSKDSFIRKKIIEQNLSYLNARLTHYLDRVGLPHTVVFQNDLTVSIEELGRELDYDNLSRGERNRLILSMSWSFRDVFESLYQPINLLFIDEMIDNGLDTAGVENALALLKQMSRERHKSIWLVSHRDELAGRVENILKVIKEGGFTSYNTDVEIV